MHERISPTPQMHLILSQRDSEIGDDILHDYVRAGFSGEMLWRIERRVAQNPQVGDRLARLDHALGRMNAKVAEVLDHTAVAEGGPVVAPLRRD
jgi:hypothetical protein